MATATSASTLAPSIMRRVFDSIDRAWRWSVASHPIFARLDRPYLVAMPALFVAALGIGAAILPGETERIAALERDGQTKRALGMLEARMARGDRSYQTLTDLQRFYEFYGETEKSRRVLELLAEQRPRDAVVQRQLAQLYKSVQDEPAYLKALQRQLTLRYSEPACREVIGLLRRSSAFEAEQTAIKSCREQGYRRAEDLVRLAFLEATDGRMAETAQILASIDDRRWLATARERLLLFVALIETRRPDEAVRRGTRWLRGQLDTDLAIDFIYRLIEKNEPGLATQLATAVGAPGDAVSLTVGEIMIDRLQFAAARPFLAGWLQQNKGMDLEVATRFVTAAIDAEDPKLALKGADRYGMARLGQAEKAALAEQLIASGHGPEFDTVLAHIGPETLAANHLVGAGADLRQGRVEAARARLLRVRADELDERRFGYFSRLVDQAGRSPALAAVLREPRQFAVVPGAAQRPQVVGPAQLQAKRGLQKSREVSRKARARVERKGPAAPGAGGAPQPSPGFVPFTLPQ